MTCNSLGHSYITLTILIKLFADAELFVHGHAIFPCSFFLCIHGNIRMRPSLMY